jgi:hypothetical protein
MLQEKYSNNKQEEDQELAKSFDSITSSTAFSAKRNLGKRPCPTINGYVICLFQIVKTDRYFNVIEIVNGNKFFVNAFYNSTKNTLFVLSYIQYQIYEFDLDLNIIDSFYIRGDIWHFIFEVIFGR